MKIPNPLRDLLPTESIKQLSQLVNQPAIYSALKDAAQKLGWKDGNQLNNVQDMLQQAGRWMEQWVDPWGSASKTVGLRAGINATGEVFNSRWTHHRECDQAIQLASLLASTYTEPNQLDTRLRHLLMGLTSAQEVLVVPNISIAVWLVATSTIPKSNANASESTVVLPRADCIRLPTNGNCNGSNLKEILDRSGTTVREIGTADDCTENDFRTALTNNVRLLFLAPSTVPNSTSGETAHHRDVGSKLAQSLNIPVCQISMHGTLFPRSLGECTLPVLSDQTVANDLVIAPCSYLIGGPDCAVILGKLTAMKPILDLAQSLGWEADNITKSKLLCCLEQTTTPEHWSESPAGRVLTTPKENLANRAQRLATQLEGSPKIGRVEVHSRSCRIGSLHWTNVRLESAVLNVYPKDKSPSAFAAELAELTPPIWGNVQSEYVELVLRTVEPDEDRIMVQQLSDLDELNAAESGQSDTSSPT